MIPIMISRPIFVLILPRKASAFPFLNFILAHLECPDILNSSQQNCVLPAYSITKRLFAQIDAFHVNMLDFVLGKIVVAGTFDLRCVSKAFEKNTRKPRFRE